jgi:hypothetical protein
MDPTTEEQLKQAVERYMHTAFPADQHERELTAEHQQFVASLQACFKK